MCGITGTTGFGRVGYEESFVDTACAALHHRGPDEQGAHRDSAVALGIRRLRVIGLVGGSQPVYSDDGTVVAVVNGEIYNHRELRVFLRGRGHRILGTSDVAVVPALYAELGEAFTERMNGMFAIALYDARTQRLVLATDRMGKKPLFHASLPDGSVAFASELDALTRHPRFERSIDPVAVDEYLSYRIVGAPRTIYLHAKRVPPATVLVFDGRGAPAERRYWDFGFTGELDCITGREAEDRLDDLLRAAVADRLESEVPLGAMLSGGLDSSLVVAVARRMSGAELHTFSVGFDHAGFDESAHAQRVAEHCGTIHHTRQITARDARQSVERIVRHVGEPFAFPSTIAADVMYWLAREHVTVVLTGDGSDEVFCGYGRYQRFLDADTGAGLASRYHGVLADGLPDALKNRLYSRNFRADLPGFPVDHLRPRFARTRTGVPDLDRVMHVDCRFWLPDAQLVKIDRMSMAHSVEPRSPLLDHRLIDFSSRIPASRKLVEGREKVLLKRVAERYLPNQVVHRRKQELAVPLEAWLADELRGDIQDALLDDRALDRGYFKPDVLRDVVAEFRPEHSYALWTLYMLERWHQIYIDRDDAAAPAVASAR